MSASTFPLLTAEPPLTPVDRVIALAVVTIENQSFPTQSSIKGAYLSAANLARTFAASVVPAQAAALNTWAGEIEAHDPGPTPEPEDCLPCGGSGTNQGPEPGQWCKQCLGCGFSLALNADGQTWLSASILGSPLVRRPF